MWCSSLFEHVGLGDCPSHEVSEELKLKMHVFPENAGFQASNFQLKETRLSQC